MRIQRLQSCHRTTRFLSEKDKDPFVFSVNKAIYEELTKSFSVLELDEFGRCETCAKIQDKK